MEQESKEMIAMHKHLREIIIDDLVQNTLQYIYSKPHKFSGDYEKETYNILRESLSKKEQRKAFEHTIKDIMIAVLFSFFDMIDEGIEMPDGKYLLLDIVNRETKDSIISYSAHEEFINLMPDGYQPFEENE